MGAALWKPFLTALCLRESLLPLPIPERGSLLTYHLFPQVPPGAAETQKAPRASELHGGHLQGTGAQWEGSRREFGATALVGKSGPGIDNTGRGLAHTRT